MHHIRLPVIPLQQARMPQPTVGACRNQRKPLLLVLQPPAGRCHQTGSRGPERMPNREGSSLDVQLVHVDVAHLVAAEVLLGEVVAGHGRKVGKDLPSECLVDLPNANIAHLHAVALQQLGRAVGRPQQQLLPRVARAERPIAQVRQRLHAELLRLALRHEQRHGGAVRQEAGVGRRVRPVRLHEGGPQLGNRLHGGIPLDAVLHAAALVRHDLVVVPAGIVRLLRHAVAAHRELVLLLPRDPELGAQLVGRHAHHLARRVVGDGGGLQPDVLGLQPPEHVPDAAQRTPLLHGLGQADELLPDGARQPNGNVREGLHPARQHHIGVAGQYLLGAGADGGVGGDAGLGDGVRPDGAGQPRVDGGLARDVGRPDLLDDVAADDVVDGRLRQRRLRQQPGDREALQVDRHLLLVDGGGLRERQADAADDHDVAGWPSVARRGSEAADR
mmetsp:Transcript_11044/g.31714  ORF Transcript_11044/g.31714 Transcript_11044/m.31714 type:complete len:445 (+) Transcript_11044:163-1497(+)